MNHNSFPTGEEPTGQAESGFAEAMADVEPFDSAKATEAAHGEASENGEMGEEMEKLERVRQALIEKQVLDVIGGADAILSTMNGSALLYGGADAKKTFEQKYCVADSHDQVAKRKGHFGFRETALRPIEAGPVPREEEDVVAIDAKSLVPAYRAGLLYFAGTEDGMRKAAKTAMVPNQDRLIISTDSQGYLVYRGFRKDRDAKTIRVIQIGSKIMSDALPRVVEKIAQRFSIPESPNPSNTTVE